MQKKDDLGQLINIPSDIKKIVSLCPSVTETLFAVGLKNKIAGRTKYCIHPEKEVINVPIVGGVQDASVELIRKINPDIIFAVKQENDKKNIEKIAAEFPVYVFDVDSINKSLNMIATIGCLCNVINASIDFIDRIYSKINSIPIISDIKTFIYLVWKNPYMVATDDTYINVLLERFDFVNSIEEYSDSYIEIDADELKKIKTEYIFLPSEPYKFDRNDKKQFQKYFPNSKVLLVDGEMFCWFGSRIIKSIDYILEIMK